jgi:hypothetical protein
VAVVTDFAAPVASGGEGEPPWLLPVYLEPTYDRDGWCIYDEKRKCVAECDQEHYAAALATVLNAQPEQAQALTAAHAAQAALRAENERLRAALRGLAHAPERRCWCKDGPRSGLDGHWQQSCRDAANALGIGAEAYQARRAALTTAAPAEGEKHKDNMPGLTWDYDERLMPAEGEHDGTVTCSCRTCEAPAEGEKEPGK